MHHLDLNLLATLDLLLAEESVSRTALRLGLSQAAVSAQLARLREHFKDELLVARGRRLVKTPFAAGIAVGVAECVRQAHAIAGTRGTFDPASANRLFGVRAGDIDTFLLLAGANRRLQREAPGIGMQISGARNTLDFRIGPLGLHDSSLPHEPLYVDDYCVLADRDHVAVDEPLTASYYLAARHVVRHFGQDSSPSWEATLMRQLGHVRKIATVVDSYASIPYFLIGTRHLSTVPYRYACEMAARFPLRVLQLPVDLPRQTIVLQWSGHLDNDPSALWFRRLLREAADDIYGALPLAASA